MRRGGACGRHDSRRARRAKLHNISSPHIHIVMRAFFGKDPLPSSSPPSPPAGSISDSMQEMTRENDGDETEHITNAHLCDTSASIHSPPSNPKERHVGGTSTLMMSYIPTFLKSIKPSLTLENSGSVARDHLASER